MARTHFIVIFKGKLTVLLPLFRFGFKRLLIEQFYFSNTMPRTNLAVRVAGAEFGIAGEIRRLPAYFDNPEYAPHLRWSNTTLQDMHLTQDGAAQPYKMCTFLKMELRREIKLSAQMNICDLRLIISEHESLDLIIIIIIIIIFLFFIFFNNLYLKLHSKSQE